MTRILRQTSPFNWSSALEQLQSAPALLFPGALSGEADFERLVDEAPVAVLDYEQEQSTPRTEVAEGVYTSTEYPADQAIFLHCEMSYAAHWPTRLLFYCPQPATAGGATPLADTQQVLQAVGSERVEEFRRRGLLYLRNFGGRFGPSWQKVFATGEKEGVESYCRAHGMEFEWRGQELQTRRRAPALLQNPEGEGELWFNHLALFHSSALPPRTRASLTRMLGETGLPQNVLFGDGEPVPDEVVEAVREAYRGATTRFDWQRGDLLLLDNRRMAHGRDPFQGERRVLVAMFE